LLTPQPHVTCAQDSLPVLGLLNTKIEELELLKIYLKIINETQELNNSFQKLIFNQQSAAPKGIAQGPLCYTTACLSCAHLLHSGSDSAHLWHLRTSSIFCGWQKSQENTETMRCYKA